MGEMTDRGGSLRLLRAGHVWEVEEIAALWWLTDAKYKQDQREAFDGLSATVSTPPNITEFDSDFTITNGSEHALGNHKFDCGVKLISFYPGDAIYAGFSAIPLSFTGQLNGGGDKQTVQCLRSVEVVGRGFSSCLDITMTLEYRLLDYPNTTKRKEFRSF